jgi:hypothetical protein
MDVENGDPGRVRALVPGRIAEQRHLHAGAAEAFEAMAGAADDQHCGGVGRAVSRHVIASISPSRPSRGWTCVSTPSPRERAAAKNLSRASA